MVLSCQRGGRTGIFVHNGRLEFAVRQGLIQLLVLVGLVASI